MPEINETYAGQTISMPIGQVIELRLKENPTTGFRWHFRKNGEPACRIRDNGVETADAAKPVRLGQGATHVWRIEGVQVGVCELALTYARSWEADRPPAATFEFRIRVTK